MHLEGRNRASRIQAVKPGHGIDRGRGWIGIAEGEGKGRVGVGRVVRFGIGGKRPGAASRERLLSAKAEAPLPWGSGASSDASLVRLATSSSH